MTIGIPAGERTVAAAMDGNAAGRDFLSFLYSRELVKQTVPAKEEWKP